MVIAALRPIYYYAGSQARGLTEQSWGLGAADCLTSSITSIGLYEVMQLAGSERGAAIDVSTRALDNWMPCRKSSGIEACANVDQGRSKCDQ